MSKKSKPLSELDKKLSPKVLQEAKIKADDMLLDLRLAELRELTELSQTQIAEAMGMDNKNVNDLVEIWADIQTVFMHDDNLLKRWLGSSIPSLNGKSPFELLQNESGKRMLREYLKCLSCGDFS